MRFREMFAAEKERYATGVVLVAAVAVIALIDSFFLTWLVLGGLFMVGFHEAMKLFDLENNSLYAFAAATWAAAAFYPNPDDLVFPLLILFASVLAYRGELDKRLFLPFLYPAASFLFLLALYNDYGMGALFWLVLAVAGADVGAYFTGKKMGKTPFCPTSPKKTQEGVIGGIVTGTLLGTVVGMTYVSFPLALFFSAAAATAAVFGDLFESYLKRQAGVKDSGAILPGHGGVLDRLDGYLFSAIILVLLLRGLA